MITNWKLWHRRWYLLARTEGVFKTFSLDRMLSLEMTEERFEMIKDFSPEKYYGEYFGVLTDGTPMAHVVLRAYGRTADYLRTLPLHDSQQELLARHQTYGRLYCRAVILQYGLKSARTS